METFTLDLFADALDALGLDPDTVTSVYLDRHWIRVEHVDHTVTALPLSEAAE